MFPLSDPEATIYLVILGLLVFGGTLRLTRLIVVDSIGGWFVRDVAQRWADRKEKARRTAIITVAQNVEASGDEPTPGAQLWLNEQLRKLDSDDPISWQARLVSGLYCPFCIGFWLGAIVLVLTVILVPLAHVGIVWVAFLALLTLNYIVGHISSRLDA